MSADANVHIPLACSYLLIPPAGVHRPIHTIITTMVVDLNSRTPRLHTTRAKAILSRQTRTPTQECMPHLGCSCPVTPASSLSCFQLSCCTSLRMLALVASIPHCRTLPFLQKLSLLLGTRLIDSVREEGVSLPEILDPPSESSGENSEQVAQQTSTGSR